ncbi:tyrosine-type recombinase/integrase [Hydrogenophaga intermedia]|uniref:tyrosine-type recombinase/integrase n=1 Tax=Hydrogenophaga intermedia TaxID=65786 RepID=UPI00204346FB|nr:integrase family protein [Hydrogenophaga intermedia]MCM3565566.1 integrase family protein [Hydrogenophaga intermedia]
MPLLTVRAIETHKAKARPYKLTLDRGLQLRIAPDGVRTLLVRYTVKGCDVERQYRLPQEYGEGLGQMKLATACAEAARIRALARDGVDWPAQEEARLRAETAEREQLDRQEGMTVAKALREYVDKKRRAKDGLPLKARTKADYLAMVEPGEVTKTGKKLADGLLFQLANKLLVKLTSGDIRDQYSSLLKRSKRQADYAMQVLRAVMRWHGVVVPGNPLGRDTAGRDRIVLTPAKGNPAPIPPERLGAWWRVSSKAPSQIAADYYRFQLLTGCRGGEIHGDKRYNYPPIKVGDVDCDAGKVVLRDTKNRSDHKLLLARQALEIASKHCAGRKPEEVLFPITDARKTLKWINAKAKTNVQGHGLRDTFASIAEELVSGGLLKRMLNHSVAGDVTLGHYVGKSEAQLRAGWQTVADFIEAAALQPTPDDVKVVPGAATVRDSVGTSAGTGLAS